MLQFKTELGDVFSMGRIDRTQGARRSAPLIAAMLTGLQEETNWAISNKYVDVGFEKEVMIERQNSCSPPKITSAEEIELKRIDHGRLRGSSLRRGATEDRANGKGGGYSEWVDMEAEGDFRDLIYMIDLYNRMRVRGTPIEEGRRISHIWRAYLRHKWL